MGNCQCQAAETAAAVIQHPNGKTERLYWTVNASEVMRSHPGHYVALLISSAVPHGGSLRVTRIKLLRPSDPLLLGHVYRLISSHEVMKGLWAKKYAKMRKIHGEFAVKEDGKHGFRVDPITRRSESDSAKDNQKRRQERQRGMSTTTTNNQGGGKLCRAWEPSLQSISESAY